MVDVSDWSNWTYRTSVPSVGGRAYTDKNTGNKSILSYRRLGRSLTSPTLTLTKGAVRFHVNLCLTLGLWKGVDIVLTNTHKDPVTS